MGFQSDSFFIAMTRAAKEREHNLLSRTVLQRTKMALELPQYELIYAHVSGIRVGTIR